MSVFSPINDAVEFREKLARSMYFLVRIARVRCDAKKLHVKNYIQWHRGAKLLEKVELVLCAVYRYLWMGNWAVRAWRLARARGGASLSLPSSASSLPSSAEPAMVVVGPGSDAPGSVAAAIASLYGIVSVADEVTDDVLDLVVRG